MIALPVGESNMQIALANENGRFHSMAVIEGKQTLKSPRGGLPIDKLIGVKIDVTIEGENADVRLIVNRRRQLRWRGKCKDVAASRQWSPGGKPLLHIAAINGSFTVERWSVEED